MSHRSLAAAVMLATAGLLLWRHELYTVQRPGAHPRDLSLIAAAQRDEAAVDAVLPAVPIGMRRLRAGDGAMLIYYWAPWQQDAYAQASALDSLRRTGGLEDMRIEIVCFDPFPSVARYVARRRLALPVLLDLRGELRNQLPCPSIPFTYVIDSAGRIAVRQPGQIDWLSRETRRALEGLERERFEPAPAKPGAPVEVWRPPGRGASFAAPIAATRTRSSQTPAVRSFRGGRCSPGSCGYLHSLHTAPSAS